jgi:DNA-binding MarR family transcriptional regulator
VSLQVAKVTSACVPVSMIDERSILKTLISKRRRRDKYFVENIFQDPAWDILLYLYLTEIDKYPATVSSVCAASCVPQTTTLRWIERLEKCGFVQRGPHPTSSRSRSVSLTSEGSSRMRGFLIQTYGNFANDSGPGSRPAIVPMI